MAETTMPATEVQTAETPEAERNSYELAFHILPTVAEEEVARVFEELKAHITKAGAEIFAEEAPERIELAYEIVKQYEGQNKKYATAYFGWVRFKVDAENIPMITESVDADTAVLRYLLIKLTRVEEAHPFRYHEQRKTDKMVTTIDEEAGDVLADPLLGAEEESAKATDVAEKTDEKTDGKTDDSVGEEK